MDLPLSASEVPQHSSLLNLLFDDVSAFAADFGALLVYRKLLRKVTAPVPTLQRRTPSSPRLPFRALPAGAAFRHAAARFSWPAAAPCRTRSVCSNETAGTAARSQRGQNRFRCRRL